MSVENRISLFDFIGDISNKKEYLFDSDTQRDYNVFMVNRGFAQHLDTVLLANEVNKMANVSKLFAHDFLFYSIDPKKRFGKWAKQNIPDLELVKFLQSKYSINRGRALEYIDMLDRDEVKKLKVNSENKGGIKK